MTYWVALAEHRHFGNVDVTLMPKRVPIPLRIPIQAEGCMQAAHTEIAYSLHGGKLEQTRSIAGHA